MPCANMTELESELYNLFGPMSRPTHISLDETFEHGGCFKARREGAFATTMLEGLTVIPS